LRESPDITYRVFISSIAFQILHLIQFSQEFLTFISTNRANVIERRGIEVDEHPHLLS
jgi:hypothetical protein